MYSYMGHHLSGKIPSRNEFMRRNCKASTMRRGQIHPLHTRGNALQGRGCSVFTTSTCTSCAPQHIVPRVRSKLLALPLQNKRGAGEQAGIVCWQCRSSHGQSSGTLTGKYRHVCLFKPHAYFSDFKEYKDSFFFQQQYFSHCYFYFHQ